MKAAGSQAERSGVAKLAGISKEDAREIPGLNHYNGHAMPDFDRMFVENNVFAAVFASIDSGTGSQWRVEIQELQRDHPGIDVGPVLEHCIQRRRLDVLRQILSDGAEINDLAVELAARCPDTVYLETLLDYGWPVNRTLQNGILPSVLWYAIPTVQHEHLLI